MSLDPVHSEMAAVFYEVGRMNSIFLCTGRPTKYRAATKSWFDKNDMWEGVYRMFMRADGDFRPQSGEAEMTDEELIAKFQARVAAGEIDLRPFGELIFGKFDQDWPARLIALARRGAAVRWRPIAEAPRPDVLSSGRRGQDSELHPHGS